MNEAPFCARSIHLAAGEKLPGWIPAVTGMTRGGCAVIAPIYGEAGTTAHQRTPYLRRNAVGLLPVIGLGCKLPSEWEETKMLVDTILQTKGTAVHTLPDTSRLADAVVALNRHNIGAVVITGAAGTIAGILSERDIVRRLGSDASALDLPVSECMSRNLVTCTRDTTVADVMERMTRHRIRHMPVVENGEMVGIISIGDVVKRKIEETEQEAAALREYIAS